MSQSPVNQGSAQQQQQQQRGQSQNQNQSSGNQNVEDLYLESYAFTTAAAIVGSVDRKIFVSLRDGRYLYGILRTFDQFANLVLQDTIERIYLKDEGSTKKFGETYRGVFLIRGENVVMIGELDIDTEDEHLQDMQQISFEDASNQIQQQRKQRIKDETAKSKQMLAKGLISDFSSTDLY
ncbi:SM-like, degradation of cytoplasmic mRNAs and positively regulates transcription initiation [Scheffersomyces spartinae]|uniref:U6 snRNA-associated Sm-like protein LSm1 n=1 Tax=Scheffersomyces spartinae TaxID=45513 RepID=A0A9P7VDK8_9ASCO|nr:SM-like, degradation of cytoplasmic mRNAs and positively regulates transcription initiation [Scheffersomyces spartinae]KAG7195548.1 SM-like, degradation of cytoplasmic mRNAs and positively regulates transcription initiation [Scheffersomyces spartinae]